MLDNDNNDKNQLLKDFQKHMEEHGNLITLDGEFIDPEEAITFEGYEKDGHCRQKSNKKLSLMAVWMKMLQAKMISAIIALIKFIVLNPELKQIELSEFMSSGFDSKVISKLKSRQAQSELMLIHKRWMSIMSYLSILKNISAATISREGLSYSFSQLLFPQSQRVSYSDSIHNLALPLTMANKHLIPDHAAQVSKFMTTDPAMVYQNSGTTVHVSRILVFMPEMRQNFLTSNRNITALWDQSRMMHLGFSSSIHSQTPILGPQIAAINLIGVELLLKPIKYVANNIKKGLVEVFSPKDLAPIAPLHKEIIISSHECADKPLANRFEVNSKFDKDTHSAMSYTQSHVFTFISINPGAQVGNLIEVRALSLVSMTDAGVCRI